MDINFIDATAFINATTKGDYEYWLQQSDIADIADTAYHYLSENTDVCFCIIGNFAYLVKELLEYKNKQKGGKSSLLYALAFFLPYSLSYLL